MTQLRSQIARYVPKVLVPFGRRQARLFDRLKGYPAARRRPGVVLMLHVGRCGSTVLANLLGQHPDIHWDGKLHRKARQLYGNKVANLDVVHWTRRQFSISGGRFYGFEFKVLDDQYPALLSMTTEEFLAASKKMGVTHYILLYRRNTLQHIISHYASKNRGSWHSQQSEKIRKRQFTLHVDDITTGSAPGRSLVTYMREVDDMHNKVRQLLQGEALIEIEYEKDIDTQDAQLAYQKVCHFLGLKSADATVRNVKVNPFPIRDVIENFEEVSEALNDTEFAWMAR